MGLNIFNLVLLGFTIGALGLPKQDDSYAYYNEQEYKDEYDYGDEDAAGVEVEGATAVLTHRPVIISEPINTDVDNGMTIRLPCIVDKLPGEIPIIWKKDDEKKTIIAMGNRIIEPEYQERATVMVDENGSTLTIGIAKFEDAGQYKCSVSVPNPPEINHIVRIQAPPTIESSTPPLVEVSVGEDLTLNCKGKGRPKPSVSWSRIGNTLPNGSQKIKSDSLQFSDVSSKHAGTYKCTASNNNGPGVSKLIEVVVKHAPEIDLSDALVLAKSSDSAKLVCSVQAYPAPKVIWYKGDKRLESSEKVTMENLGSLHSLILEDVQKNDFGIYTCKASNSLGSHEKSIKLSGFATPAEFTSSATGDADNSFLIEWSSKSLSKVEEFLLEVATSPFGTWKEYSIKPSAAEGHAYMGKHFLSDLQPSTPYKARVKSRNGEGWGVHSMTWNFATKGAVPSPASVTASAVVTSPTSLLLLINASLYLLIYHSP